MMLANFAILATGLFTGAAVYVSLVEQPARMACPMEVAMTHWRPSYQRASVMQASLAVLGTLMALAVWNKGASDTWLVAGLLLGAVVPFTFLVMWPTNKQLNDARLYSSDEVARGLLRRWGWLHSVRAALSVAALVLMLFDT
jgi:hypothetical protein